MSCLISFERCQSSCEEHGTSEHYNKNLINCRIRTTNSVPLALSACCSNHSDFGAVDDLRLKLLQCLFSLRYYKNSIWCAKGYKEDKNKIITYLQFRNWFHLNTIRLTQKKKYIMFYMSMTIYNIYSFFIKYCPYCLYHNLFLLYC